MKSLVLAVTLALVAIQFTCAAPAPENEKKEAAGASPPGESVDASPRVAEAKGDNVGITAGVEDATPWLLRDATKGPAVPAEKAQ